MNSNFTRAALLALLSLGGGAELLAQTFTNNTNGTYTASCNAVIRLKSTTPAVSAGGTYFNGTAILGSTSTAGATGPIQGVVDYARTSVTANTQQVQGLYYSYLFLSGSSSKDIADGVHLYGSGCATTMFTGYTQLSSTVPYYATNAGGRVYNGTIYYDAPAGTQNIFAENGATSGADRYNNLSLAGGAKTTNGVITLDGALTSTASTPLTIGANFNIANNTATPTNVQGTITVSAGTLTQSGTAALGVATGGSLTIGAGASLASTGTGTGHINVAGSLTLDNDATATLNLPNGSYLDISGTFANNFAAKTNMTFGSTSTVAYTGAGPADQTIVGTVATNDYGNLVFSGAAIKKTTENVFTVGTVAIAGGPIQMNGTSVFDVDVTGRATSPISFASANNDEYIRGKVNLSGTIGTGIPYVMNNAQTQATFATAPSCFQLDILPVTAPTFLNNFSTATDANRSITLTYCGNTGVLSNFRLGYTAADVQAPGYTGTEARFRMVEGFSATAAGQKLTGGAGIATNNGAFDARYVQLAGTIALNAPTLPGGSVGELSSGSNIVLTSVPNTFIAVNPGRWTNPNVWDEGAVPTALDNAEIRTLVYAGIKSVTGDVAFGTATTGNDIPETTHYAIPANGGNANSAAANSILIASGATYPGSTLIIGNEDNPAGYVFHTATTPGATSAGVLAGFVNNNALSTIDVTSKTPTTGINGLFVTGLGANTSIFGTAVITNNGTINNKGIIEIGE